MRTQELFDFIRERHNIYIEKAEGAPKPWTKDPILQQYRFCNVYRELDTQTQWYRQNWRYKGGEFPWFTSMVFRYTNWHETAQLIGFPEPWNEEHFLRALKAQKDMGCRVFNPAYIISTNGIKMDKAAYVAALLGNAWQRRRTIAGAGYGLGALHSALTDLKGVGSFMAAQVVADVKYLEPYKSAADWYTFAASGPGSRRGLNRIYNHPVGKSWKESMWHIGLIDLHRPITELVAKAKMPTLHAQDLQNCLCEFDKYERVRLGEGRPKQLYNGRN